MKTFEILFTGMSSGYITVEANSREEAEQIFDGLSQEELEEAAESSCFFIESID